MRCPGQTHRDRLFREWQAIGRLGAGLCIAAIIVATAFAQEPPPPPADAPREALSPDDVEILTRGPVHEGFAEPLANNPAAGLTVPQQPPPEISEVAPDFKPEGNDVVWIPGYWAWDDDRDSFLWVSGIWRKLPPGRRWIPGYWDDVDGGWQWTAGLWVPDAQDELTYRVAPPESLENGPNTPPPNDSYFWVPGCWMWHDTGHRWRPGYWHPYQENWVWVPAHWVWTPSGCLYVAGYWDYRVSTRGQLFAPVYFRRNNWYASHYYSPTCVVESTPLLIHFWVRPRYSHYYFGDYYGPKYATLGLSPWSRWHSHPGHFDPLLTHYNVHYRHHDHFDYAARMSHWHSHYDSHIDDRPRRTFRDQQQFAGGLGSQPSQIGQQALLGVALAAAVSRSDRPVALRPVTPDHKQFHFRESNQLRELTRDRAKSEKVVKVDPGRDSKNDVVKGGLVPDLKGKVPDVSKVEPSKGGATKPAEAGKSPAEATVKLKPNEPGKSLTELDAKSKVPQRPAQGAPLKLPKPTVTTSKLAAETPQTPTQVTPPTSIDRKDLPKVAPANPLPPVAGQSPVELKTRPGAPKLTPRSEPPKVQPKVEPPKVQPKVEPPKVQPKVEPPKVEPPKVQPKVEPPKVQPKVEPPKVQPKVEPPKVQPKVEPPKAQPKVEPPRAPPKAEQPKTPKVEPPKRSDPPKKGK